MLKGKNAEEKIYLNKFFLVVIKSFKFRFNLKWLLKSKKWL